MPLILLGSFVVSVALLGWLGIVVWVGLWLCVFGLLSKL